ncbi:uncharacterized protein LOC113281097 isoform X1 [Papaver somniferum]|uniref:uncharacterized protein LOC113281097 isoform X1 n=1 Tax=Papaver somniferum TaxID=3469 RepID=UPI000E700B6D|nr:uncharacterized protein LOC113281097 isoform X1 [Papaver somniferum]XP_026385528.1 uncharacterized protein LOC113281097 isoform X1 [Papaver somniferum]
MSLTFNGYLLVEKLAKLDCSQLSIQTVSHWCMFHRKKAKQLVETWDRQFYCSPREQRLAFLYLANDILQNSRSKGPEFIVEFWKVLPKAFHDIVENGAESQKNAAERLIEIWEERKVFDFPGKVLRDELMRRSMEKNNKDAETLSRELICVGEDKKLSSIQVKVPKSDEPMGRGIETSNGAGHTLSRKLIGVGEEKKLSDVQGKVLTNDEPMGCSTETSNGAGHTFRKLIGVGKEKKLSNVQGKVLGNDEPVGGSIEKSNGDGDTLDRKLQRQSVGSMVDKIISSYEIVCDGTVDEVSLLRKCGKAIAFVDKVDKEIGRDNSTGKLNQSELNELHEQHGILRESIEQLSAAESSRTNLITRLKEALKEQELKLVQIRLHLEAAQIRSEKAENICQHLINSKSGDLQTEQRLNETSVAVSPPSFTSETLGASGDDKGKPAPIIKDTPQGPSFSRGSSNMKKGNWCLAAAVLNLKRARKIQAAEDYIRNQQNHASAFDKCPSGKRTKLENGAPSYTQSQQLASEPLPYIPHPGSPQHLSSSPVALPAVPLQKPYSSGMSNSQQRQPPSPMKTGSSMGKHPVRGMISMSASSTTS